MNSGFTDFSTVDPHTKLTDRFENQLKVLETIYKKASNENATVIFGGDLFHDRTKVDTVTFNNTFRILNKYSNVNKVFLRGNHDSINETMGSPASIDLLDTLDNSRVASVPQVVNLSSKVKLYCLPYSNNNKLMKDQIRLWADELDTEKVNILIAHLGVDGSKGVGNRVIEGPFKVADMHSDKFDLVYLGHYHMRQALTDNMFYGGSTIENSFSDSGSDKGYDVIDIDEDNLTLKQSFEKSVAPQFLTATNLDEAKEMVKEGNYVKFTGTKDDKDVLDSLDDLTSNHIRFIRESTSDHKELEINEDRIESPLDTVRDYVKSIDSSLLDKSLECLEQAMRGE